MTGAVLPVTVLTNANGLLTKRYWLDAAGDVEKDTRCLLGRGTATLATAHGLHELAAILDGLEHSQAVAYGVTGHAEARVVTKKELHEQPGAIARSREFFAFPKGPAVLMLDHDSDHTQAPIETGEALRAKLVEACPELTDAPMLWRSSASSFIERTDTGEQIAGLRGQRIYIPVIDGSDIPRAGRALYERLWLAGFGRYVVAKGGDLLDRNLIDASVFDPERLDFAAGAKCTAPLVQRRPPAIVWHDPAGLFDSRLVADLSADEREVVKAHRDAARGAVAEEAHAVRTAYINDHAKALVESHGLTIERALHVVGEAVTRHKLFAEFVLHPEDGAPVTVGQVLDDPVRWHGRRFGDPMEPDYRNDKRISWVNLRSGGRPYLHSFAHGGRRFELLRQPTLLRVQDGEDPRLVDETLRVLLEHGEVFDFGRRSLARVAGRNVIPIERDWLQDYVGRVVSFERFDGRSKDWKPTNTPEKVPRYIMARVGERGLPQLVAVVTAPTLRADGSVLDVPGFDRASGLLYLADDAEPPRVPAAPGFDQVQQALVELWEPFAQFPFVDAVDRGVMLAALLTATIRRALPTAPGFAFDAPAAGSGKTLLASCVSALGGHKPSMTPPPREDDEARKALFAALRQGAGVVLWDNLVRPLEGASLNAFLTAENFTDRVLGQSELDALPNRALFLATGNNLRLVGDVCRRVLVCRVDPRVEVPYLRQFGFDPLAWVRDRRQRLVRAALTILRGYQTSGVALAAGRLASFEDWDDLVRQCVVWAGELGGPVAFGDPAGSALVSVSEDPAKGTLAAVLAAWHSAFGARRVPVREAWALAHDELGDNHKALRDALDAVADGDVRFDPRRLGLWLAKHRGEIANGLFFADSMDTRSQSKHWGVESVE
jgi:hypothetical protein